ncbi:LamG domain-containing protein [Streptomyces caniscabiei]|uniref:LamG domain-containing protein n=1 Tax=Streptomyces caniscabiei TaxID=2746961 RepID=UPI0029BA5478|nr:LamG domain-containing protein [Streptomyces caniscabiei]MDX2776141.1 LamG domain-containing protein [Streptomyces caniscabiei]
MSLPSFRVSAFRRREQSPNLLAAWGFDEGVGTTAGDSSSYALPLTLSGGATWVAGHTGGTAVANSGVGSANRANWTSLSSPATIMGWVRPTDLTAGTSRPLFGIWSGTTPSTSTQFAIWAQRSDFSTSNVLQGNVRVDGGLVAVNHTALTLNTWVHVALSFDGTALRLFRDGIEVSTFTNTGGITPGTYAFLVVPDSANAQVDDVRVFNAALSAAQIIGFMGDPVAP